MDKVESGITTSSRLRLANNTSNTLSLLCIHTMFNTITLILFIGIWPVWLIWELVLLRLRATTYPLPKTISMVARDIGWKTSILVYLWGGLATHYWWPSTTWATAAGSIIFWAIALSLLIEDIIIWARKLDRSIWPKWLYWQRLPIIVLVFGAIMGKLLFPQAL